MGGDSAKLVYDPGAGRPREVGNDSMHLLLRALKTSGISVFYQDPDLNIRWAQNLPAAWLTESAPMTDHDLLPAAEADRLVAAKRRVLASGGSETHEIRLGEGSAVVWFDVCIEADRDDTGRARGILTTILDTTDQKHREQTLRTLLREVSHRSKNLLAIIQSIATQTGRYSGTIDVFMARFRGRLQSLSSSQDLVTSSNWRGAELRELVSTQLARYTTSATTAARYEGINPYLNPNAALHIGLALHELAVNSVSFGALSRPDGFVTIAARRLQNAGEEALEVTWHEDIGPDDASTRQKRFGSVALEKVVPASLNGEATLDIKDGRLRYRLIVPRGSFELE